MASLTSFGSTSEKKAEKAHNVLRDDFVCVSLFGSPMIFFGGRWDDNLNLLLIMDGVWSFRELVSTSFENSLVGVRTGGLSRSWVGFQDQAMSLHRAQPIFLQPVQDFA